MVADGLSRAEIGHEIVVSYDEGPNRDAMWRYVFEAQDALSPAGMTELQRERVESIRQAISSLRDSRLPVGRQRVAELAGVDRKTLNRYIDNGWVTLD
jgi:hypothetical protein